MVAVVCLCVFCVASDMDMMSDEFLTTTGTSVRPPPSAHGDRHIQTRPRSARGAHGILLPVERSGKSWARNVYGGESPRALAGGDDARMHQPMTTGPPHGQGGAALGRSGVTGISLGHAGAVGSTGSLVPAGAGVRGRFG